ncbi:hypothetical protein ABPG74_002135 [Tetrahymena malaccensis]
MLGYLIYDKQQNKKPTNYLKKYFPPLLLSLIYLKRLALQSIQFLFWCIFYFCSSQCKFLGQNAIQNLLIFIDSYQIFDSSEKLNNFQKFFFSIKFKLRNSKNQVNKINKLKIKQVKQKNKQIKIKTNHFSKKIQYNEIYIRPFSCLGFIINHDHCQCLKIYQASCFSQRLWCLQSLMLHD